MREATYHRGVLHGRAVEWHRNGRLAEEGEYEHGFALWKKRWDEAGNLTEDYRLDETDPDYQRLPAKAQGETKSTAKPLKGKGPVR